MWMWIWPDRAILSSRTKRQSFIEYVSVKPLDGKTKEIKYQRETWLLKGPIAIAWTADCSRVTMDARWWWSSAAGVPRRNDRMQHYYPSWAFFQSRWMLWFPFCCYDKYWNETWHWVGKDLFDLHSQVTVRYWGGQGRNSGRCLRKKLCWECCFLA